MTTVATIAPYMQTPDGFVVFLEAEDGPRLTPDGDGIILMSGMIHGPLEKMCRQVDYVFHRAEATGVRRVIAVIDTHQPSFRFPDASMRRVFKHLRTFESKLSAIYFWRLPLIMRKGMQLFALPLLSASLKQRVFLNKPDSISVEFDRRRYLEWRTREEGMVALPEAEAFDSRELARSREALRVQVASGDFEETFCFREWMEKQGRGGVFGSFKWKRKNVGVTATHLIYRDDASIERIDRHTIQNVELVDDLTVRVTAASPAYTFRASSPSSASEFVRALSSSDTRLAFTTASYTSSA